MRQAIFRALTVSDVRVDLVKVVEDTKRIRATGLPVYRVLAKQHGAKRGRAVAEFIWIEA